jgi:hypothetical protein
MTDMPTIKDTINSIIGANAAEFPRVTYANQITDFALPYVVLQVVPTGQNDPTLMQTAPVWTGFLMATVVSDIDAFDMDADTMARDLATLFPPATRQTMSDGNTLLFSDQPQFLEPMRDGMRWRTAVRINLQTA